MLVHVGSNIPVVTVAQGWDVVKEHIRKIRNKLSAYTDKNYIETVWGVGYKWAK